VDDGRWLQVASAAIAILALVLPLAAGVYSVVRIGRRGARRVWRATSDRPVWRAAAVAGGVAVVAGLAWLWWPNGEYEPIGSDDRGTLIDGVSAATKIGTGRPALADEEELETDVVPGDAEAGVDPVDPTGDEDTGDEQQAPAPTTVTDEPGPTTTVRRTTSTTLSTATTAAGASEESEQGESTQ
jgi:hypothetical protein